MAVQNNKVVKKAKTGRQLILLHLLQVGRVKYISGQMPINLDADAIKRIRFIFKRFVYGWLYSI